ncbi:hypothetical protein HID58_036192 [Brassica napus]|uniref:Uncharacterized protein n=1 Tax=Brassica napus TaxID=3708 RepID=A0ABQ8C708_BRANA|nr:hypothetical protein HID58_036192 [Brassica napus]
MARWDRVRRSSGEAMMRRKSLETSDNSGWLLLGTLAMMCSMRTSGNDSKEGAVSTSPGCSCGFLFGAPPLSPSGMSEITAIVAV